MRMVIQRVTQANVTVEGKEVGAIQAGLLVLVGFAKDDKAEQLAPAVEKLLNLRIFPDDKGRFMFSVKDSGGGVLAVPQFTLFADTSKGRRPEFFGALEPKLAREFFAQFAQLLKTTHLGTVATGEFGAHMQVSLVNDGPVTIALDDQAA